MANTRKIILTSSIGTLVEWAEFCFYGYLVHLFSHLFFPMLSNSAGIIAAFGAFAISYVARPIGGLLFGHIGDKFGRQRALSGAILLMGLATLGMGLLPSYASIGIAAPILLVLLRLLQGIAVAGEYTGAAVYILEHHQARPYFASSWIGTSSAAGMLVGALFGVIVSLPAMPDWAWRIPFYCGFIGCLVGVYVRNRLSETEQFQQLLRTHSTSATPIKTLLKHYKKPLLQIGAIAAFVGIFIYTCNLWWVTFMIDKGYFTPLQARSLATIAQGCVVFLTPAFGLLADKWDGRRIMYFGIAGNVVVTLLLFITSTQGASLITVGCVELLYGITQAALSASMFKYFADIFPAAVRYSGQAIGWNVAVAIFGGTAPIVAQLLSEHYLYILVSYVMLSGIIALVMNYSRSPQACSLTIENTPG